MTLVLYDNPASSNALKARFVLAETGLEYERRLVPFDLPRPAEYLALNPLGGIPTLLDGDVVVAESNAILRYIARRAGRTDLYPTEPVAAARIDTFLDRWSLSFRPEFFKHEAPALGFAPGKGMGGAEPDPAAAALAAESLAPTLARIEALIADNGTALGTFTIADMCAGPIVFRTTKTGLDLSPYPRLLAWRQALLARPSFVSAGPVT